MKNWILVRKAADYEYLSKELNIDPVAVRIMVNRGITELEDMKRFLDTDISDCFSYEGLPNIKEAVLKIKEAADKKLKCRIVGDYDADGQTVQQPAGWLSPDTGQEASCPGTPEIQLKGLQQTA